MMQAPGRGGPPLGTAFTVSIEARHGVTTGISAADRAHTIRVAASPDARPEDLVTPGHVFPLRARKGGVLVRTGQTEGSVDLARLAGLTPAGVICEIMNEDGTMARMPDLESFAEKHGLRILTIADLIQYRLQTERLVRRVAERTDPRSTQTGTEWTRDRLRDRRSTTRQFLALVEGRRSRAEPVLCRVHSGSTIGDVFASTPRDGGPPPARGDRADRGRRARRHSSTSRRGATSRRELESWRAPTTAPPTGRRRRTAPLREFGLGAQVLADLGLHADPPAHEQPA